jgi:hypothetical protein
MHKDKNTLWVFLSATLLTYMVPKVDTFEGDIADEIKRKEASLAEISAASNDVGNNDDDAHVVLPKKSPVFFIALLVSLMLCVLGFAGLAYYYLTDPLLTPKEEPVILHQSDVPKISSDLKNISPTLATEIGRFVSHVEKREGGYILTISDYSSVFAYMTRNESSYIDELSLLFKESTTTEIRTISQQTTFSQEASTTPGVKSTTTLKVATSSQKETPKQILTSSSTSKAQTPTIEKNPVSVVETPVSMENTSMSWSDVTVSNQNMRVWTSGKKTVIYAFVGDKTIVLANSLENILALRSAILK